MSGVLRVRNAVTGVVGLAVVLASGPAVAGDAGTADLEARGEALYAERCRECHGRRGEKKALRRSKVLNRLDRSEIVAKLRDFQTARQAKEMKDRMKGGLSDDDIRSLVTYVLTLRGK